MSQLLEQVRAAVRTRHYSIRTEEAYLRWIREYILFFEKRHPAELGAADVSAFVSHLAVERKVAASTQSQALSTLLFLYREVLALPIGWVDDVERAKKPKRLPVVFTREEARAVLGHLRGELWLMASLLYGSGLRLMECVRLRVKDLDPARLQLTVRDGKGGKDRVTVLPTSLSEPLERQLERARVLHELDVREGFERVYLHYALARKYPSADRESGVGSTSFRHVTGQLTLARGASSGITSRRPPCRRRSRRRSGRPGWRSPGAATPSATPSPRT
jgi:integron integrase